MITVNKLLPGGQGLSAVLLKRAATVVLDWDTRQKSRFDASDSQGRALGVFLPRGSVVRGGDVLVAEDGTLIRVVAQPQPVMRVTPCAAHGTPFDLVRAAYHLGNRHVPLELNAEHLQFEPDHVLAGMLQQMDLTVTEQLAPFEPEGGAYAASAAGHGHAPHAEAASHIHAEDPAHARSWHAGHAPHDDDAPHVHGPGCKHEH